MQMKKRRRKKRRKTGERREGSLYFPNHKLKIVKLFTRLTGADAVF